MYGNFGGKRGIAGRNRASDEAQAVLDERGRAREGGRGARGGSQHLETVVRWCVEKVGRSLRRRTGAST